MYAEIRPTIANGRNKPRLKLNTPPRATMKHRAPRKKADAEAAIGAGEG